MSRPTESNLCVVLLYRGCTIAEVIDVSTRLADADHKVVYVSVDGGDVIDQSGLMMVPDRAVDEFDPSKASSVIVPGGDPEEILGSASIRGLLTKVATSGGVIAGICAGVLVLGDAGLLRDRHITHNYRAPWASPEIEKFVEPLLQGADVEPTAGATVCVDHTPAGATIVTALPNATIEFSATICQLLGLIDDDGGELLRRHLMGEFVPELFESE